MGESLQAAAREHRADAAPPPHTAGGRLGWRRLQIVAGVVAIVSFVIPMAAGGKVEGFLVAMAAPFLVGLVLSLWLPRTGAIFLGVVSVAIVLASAPFIFETLTHPEALIDFVSLLLLTVSCVVGAASAIPAFREARTGRTISRAPRWIAVAAGAVTLAAAAISVVAASGVQDVRAQPGDISIRAEDFAFAPAAIQATAGTVSVHIANTDSARHTFTIDGVTDVSVAPSSTQRATFEAEPGTYRFYCIPHAADMDGELVVK